MKLLICWECSDLFKLHKVTKTCVCGKVKGAYNSDGDTAWFNGQGMLMGLGNNGLTHMLRNGLESGGEIFRYPVNNGKITIQEAP